MFERVLNCVDQEVLVSEKRRRHQENRERRRPARERCRRERRRLARKRGRRLRTVAEIVSAMLPRRRLQDWLRERRRPSFR